MRKSLGIMLILLALAVSLAAVSGVLLAREGEAVEIEETVLFGDKAAAAGLRLRVPVVCQDKLFWETEYVIGSEDKPETNFRFLPDGEKIRRQGGNSFVVGWYIGGGASVSGGTFDLEHHAPYGMGKILGSVADRTVNGEEHTETIRLRDYWEYYPLTVEVMIGGNYFGDVHDYLNEEEAERIAEARSLISQINIPVPEDDRMEVTISKNQDGGVYSYNVNSQGSDLLLNSCCAATEDMFYYSFYCPREQAGENMEDWYGIYSVPYRTETDGYREWVKLEAGQAKRAAALDPDARLLAMEISDDQKKLLVFTAEDGICVMTVYEIGSMNLLQRLEIMPARDEFGFESVIRREKLLVPVVNGKESLAVITESEQGVYELEFVSEFLSEGKEWNILDGYGMEAGEMKAAYDGERLALTYSWPYYAYGGDDSKLNPGSLLAFVFENGRMTYCGICGMSQCMTEPGGQWKSCRIWTEKNVDIGWAE